MANGRCRVHGGATPRGLASPHWRHGRHSRALFGLLADYYANAKGDPDYLSLADEIALIDGRINELFTQALEDERAPSWSAIGRLIEQRRRLVETEHKRLEAAKQMLTREQARELVVTILEIIRNNIDDRMALERIQRDIIRLVTPPDR